ncbi:MAG TPA: GHMP kinase [Pirellulales bacterium]|nr:GHMP kinase [Pirellulales bacterium]
MIISRTPLRISFAGGGSDFKEFYAQHGGAVLSVAIRKYVYLSLHPMFHRQKIFLKYSESELVDSVAAIRHRIIREVFSLYSISGVDFNSSADVPAGTGLGGSSAFTVGLIQLCNAYTNQVMYRRDIAEQACHVEIERLASPIGKQDQYAATFGGMNYFRFRSDGRVDVQPIFLDGVTRARLQSRLRMFYLGETRAANSVLAEQQKNLAEDARVVANVKRMVRLADELRVSVGNGHLDEFGDMLHTGWMYKKEMARTICNDRINHFYDLAMKNGALGGKLLGAGQGGFLLFYVPESEQDRLRRALAELDECEVEFDDAGTTIIYDDRSHMPDLAKVA